MRLHTGKLFGKSTPECAEHVENRHAGALGFIFIQFPTLLPLSGRLRLGNNACHVQACIKRLAAAGSRAGVQMRQRVRKDLAEEGRVVWQSGEDTEGRDQPGLCSSLYRILTANALVVIKNKISRCMYPHAYFVTKPQVP